jgi:type II secretory pathway pseudopilin PulG
MKYTPHLLNIKGFSLVELAIIITIFSLLLAGLMNGKTIKRETQRVEAADAAMDTLQYSLQAFFQKNGYLPCPASLAAAPDTATYGISTDCSLTAAPAGTTHVGNATDEYQIRVGAVPTRTLGIADGYGLDAWGNRLSYVVLRQAAVDQAGYDAYVPTQASDYFQIVNAAAAVTYGVSSSELIAYALINYGADGRGAFSKAGSAGLACSTTSADAENCDADKQWMDAPVNEIQGASYFYDFVLWVKKSDLDAL